MPSGQQLHSWDLAVSTISILSIVLSFILCFCIWIVYAIKAKRFDSIEKWTISAILLFGLSSGFLLSQFAPKPTDSHPFYLFCGLMIEISWRIGSVCVYKLFLIRLQITFKDTQYQISKSLIHTFHISFVIFVLLILYQCAFFIAFSAHSISLHTFEIHVSIELTVSAFVDLVISVSLIGLFMQKLWTIIKEISIYEMDDTRSNASTLNDKQISIIQAISKLTILSSFAIVSSQIFLCWSAITFYLDKSGINDRDRLIWDVYVPIDCMINSMCLFLSFDFAKSTYLMCCGGLDNLCVFICSKLSQKKVDELTKSLLSDEAL